MMAVDIIAEVHSFGPWTKKFRSLIAEGRIGRHRILLVKPQTFMNDSGDAVQQALHFYKLDWSESRAEAQRAVDEHRRHGTTSLVASLVTAPADVLLSRAAMLADLADAGEIVGVHLEGPFLSADRCGAQNPADMLPGELTQGQRKLVGVARALAAQPHVVCLDEPAAGLDTSESEELGRRLRQIVDGGTAMLLIDHDMGLVLSICDQVIVLEFGKVIAQGTPEVVTRDPKVVEAYLGGASAEVADEVQAAAADAGANQ
jgi:acyl-coenzyme A thioesterase PaaI-like protein